MAAARRLRTWNRRKPDQAAPNRRTPSTRVTKAQGVARPPPCSFLDAEGTVVQPFFFGRALEGLIPFSKLAAGAEDGFSFLGFLISLLDFC